MIGDTDFDPFILLLIKRNVIVQLSELFINQQTSQAVLMVFDMFDLKMKILS